MKFWEEVEHVLSAGVKQWTNWRSLRKEVIKFHPECSACGYNKKLEVHHIIPRHIDPALALDWDNLIVLCRDCHFHIGHWCDFDNSNPYIVEIGEFLLLRRKALPSKISINLFD